MYSVAGLSILFLVFWFYVFFTGISAIREVNTDKERNTAKLTVFGTPLFAFVLLFAQHMIEK